MLWGIALAAGVLLVIAALFSNIFIEIDYVRNGKNDEFDCKVRALYGLVRVGAKVPKVKMKPKLGGIQLKLAPTTKEGEGPPRDVDYSMEELRRYIEILNELLTHMKNVHAWLSGTLQHLHVTKLRWDTRFGLPDAAQTGMACGALWGMTSGALGYVSRWVTFETQPALQITPVFNEPMFQTELQAKGRIRMHRMLSALFLLFFRILRKRGSWKVWLRLMLGLYRQKRPA